MNGIRTSELLPRSRCPLGPRLTGLVAGLTIAGAAAIAQGGAWLDATLPDGTTSITVPEGGTFFVRVSVNSDVPVAFNAALLRLLFSTEGAQILDYDWTPPFVTDGPTDFSLDGLALPVLVMADTLSGPGLPPGVADVEFGNVSLFQDASDGTLLEILVRAPLDAPPGSSVAVAAVPDLFTDAFAFLPISTGSVILVTIANSGVPGDFSGDGTVDSIDLGLLLSNWGGMGLGDLDQNGVVDSADIGELLTLWS